MDANEPSEQILGLSDATGGVLLPALVATIVGGYKMATLPWPTTNGQLLFTLGVLALAGGALATWRRWLAWLIAPLGFYAFGVIGCLAFGLAISEGSGWGVLLVSAFWVVFGWHLLSRMGRLMQFIGMQQPTGE